MEERSTLPFCKRELDEVASRLGMIIKVTRVVNCINSETMFQLDTDNFAIENSGQSDNSNTAYL